MAWSSVFCDATNDRALESFCEIPVVRATTSQHELNDQQNFSACTLEANYRHIERALNQPFAIVEELRTKPFHLVSEDGIVWREFHKAPT